MSLKQSYNYFRARCKVVGLREWSDGFNSDNIPSSIIDKSYHIKQGQITGIKLNQNDQEVNFPIVLEVFVKGFRDPYSAIETSAELVEDILIECLKATNRVTQGNGIKNITFESAIFEPISANNDNAVKTTINFRVLSILGL